MKITSIRAAALGSAVLAFSASGSDVHNHHAHQHFHDLRRSTHLHGVSSSHPESASLSERSSLVARNSGGKALCKLPNDPDLVRVPGAMNNGFAMSPDQECVEGTYCPIACKPGKVMAQWEPGSTFTYPSSMNGGLLCGSDGQPQKPFKNKPYCVDGAGTISAVNECGKPLSFCQTILPGNEAMLSPTVVGKSAVLAVPDPSYWESTSAHYYINPPGVEDEGCIWGDSSKPVGNWATYVAGANQDSKGQTFVTLGYNPIWEDSGLKSTKPGYAVKIECPGGGCNGTPCSIDPSKNAVGEVTSDQKSTGAGGSQFCVVTVPKGSKANIVVYSIDGSGGGGGGGNDDKDEPEPSKEPEPEPEPTSEEPEPEPTPTPTPEPSPEPEPSSTSESSSSSEEEDTSSSEEEYLTVRPGIFHENDTDTETSSSAVSKPTSLTTTRATESVTSDTSEPAPTTSDENEGTKHASTAVAGLIVAFVAAAVLY